MDVKRAILRPDWVGNGVYTPPPAPLITGQIITETDDDIITEAGDPVVTEGA